jgi:hypothetical protein
VGILFRAKDGSQDAPSRIIEGREQDELRAPSVEPAMMTAIHLDQEPGLRHAVAPSAMAWGAADAGTRDPGSAEEALYGPSRQPEALPLRQELGEVMVIEARIAGAGQLEDVSADRLSETAWRGPAPVAMGKGLEPLAADAGEEPAHMAQ